MCYLSETMQLIQYYMICFLFGAYIGHLVWELRK